MKRLPLFADRLAINGTIKLTEVVREKAKQSLQYLW